MSLLHMTSRRTPSADDLVPVLIYVLIKVKFLVVFFLRISRTPHHFTLSNLFSPLFHFIQANPPFLLSTIQYVTSFIGDEIEGEDRYWWTQFCSAVEFIKTMDYRV